MNFLIAKLEKILEFVIDKETDANSDRLNDDTGDEILGYANGTILFFWVQVLNITKSAENTPESSEFTVQVENISENYLYCNVRTLFPFDFLDN